MRTALESLDFRREPFHVGLAYERAGILEREGGEKDATERRDARLDDLANARIDPDYADFYRRWEASLRSSEDARILEVELCGRLLVGHGNPSQYEVGLTLHHTWGVPVIPGSAIKGLLAHFIVAHYAGDEAEHEPWRGVEFSLEGGINRGPGWAYARIFGAPDSKADPQGARGGELRFHDAVYIPGSCERDRPLERDVLTVHQTSYYNTRGGSFPNDHDDPNPVAFLSVRPGARFLLAIEGPTSLRDPIEPVLLAALDEWGVGGKTTLGYGRLQKAEPRGPTSTQTPPPRGRDEGAKQKPRSTTLTAFMKWMNQPRPVAEMFELLLAQWSARLLELDDDERRLVANQIGRKMCKRADLKVRIDELVGRLRNGRE